MLLVSMLFLMLSWKLIRVVVLGFALWLPALSLKGYAMPSLKGRVLELLVDGMMVGGSPSAACSDITTVGCPAPGLGRGEEKVEFAAVLMLRASSGARVEIVAVTEAALVPGFAGAGMAKVLLPSSAWATGAARASRVRVGEGGTEESVSKKSCIVSLGFLLS